MRKLLISLTALVVVGLLVGAGLAFLGGRERVDDAEAARTETEQLNAESTALAASGRRLDRRRRAQDLVTERKVAARDDLLAASALLEQRLDGLIRASQQLSDAQNRMTALWNDIVEARNQGNPGEADRLLGQPATRRQTALQNAQRKEQAARKAVTAAERTYRELIK